MVMCPQCGSTKVKKVINKAEKESAPQTSQDYFCLECGYEFSVNEYKFMK